MMGPLYVDKIPAKYKTKPTTLDQRVAVIDHVLRLYPEKPEDSFIIYYDPQTHAYKVVDELHNNVDGLSDVSFVSRLKAELHLSQYLSQRSETEERQGIDESVSRVKEDTN